MSQNATSPNSTDVQQLLYVYDVLENQEKTLVQQLNLLENQTQGVELSKKTMEEFRVLAPGHETLMPVGTNAYTSAKLVNPEKVIVRINNEVLIEKDLEEGITSMHTLLDTYKKIHEKLHTQLQDVQSKIQQIRPQIEAIYRHQGGKSR